MTTQRSIRLALAGAVALALMGGAAIATAQTATTQGAPPAAPAENSSQFIQGTESTATYPLPDSNGGTLTVHAGMSAQVKEYGPPPPFTSLDTNHDGRISEQEAEAYPPLDSDFLFASQQGKSITKAQYQAWVSSQH